MCIRDSLNTAVLSVFAVLGEKIKLLKRETFKKRNIMEEKNFLGKILNSLMLAHDMLWEMKKGLSKEEIRRLFAGNMRNSAEVKEVFIYEGIPDSDEMKLAFASEQGGHNHIADIIKKSSLKGLFLKNIKTSSLGVLSGNFPANCIIVPIKENDDIREAIFLVREVEFDHSDIYIIEFFSVQVFVILEKNELFDRLKENYEKIIEVLALAIDTKDHEKHGHSMAAMEFAVKIAEKMGLNEGEKEKIKYASLLHDIGNINLNGNILNKPGALTPEEYETVKIHSGEGMKILGKMNMFEEIIPIVLHHHEHFDGKGYPYKLKGNDIPMGSRICAVADAYSVMRSDRPYRSKMSKKEAVAELKKHAGTQFDRQVVDVFLEILKTEEEPGPDPAATINE